MFFTVSSGAGTIVTEPCSWLQIAAIFVVSALFASNCAALNDDAAVPVLLYHPQTIGPNCTADDTDVLALQRDLGLLRDMGFTPKEEGQE